MNDDRKKKMLADNPDKKWDDPALHACDAWLRAYRGPTRRPCPDRPSLRFASHLGRCARDVAGAGTPDGDLLRSFSLAGSAGRCVCGKRPTDHEFAAAE